MPNTYVALRTETVAVATNSVTLSLSGISGYTDLVLVFNGGTTSSGPTMRMTVNGDTGTNYSDTALDGTGSSAVSTRHSNANFMAITNNVGIAGTLGAQTTIIQLQNYSNTTTYKTVLFRANNATATGFPGVTAAVGLWRNTAAITSISLTTASTTFLVGSTFSLYGIANADNFALATGGIITEDSQYWYHTFGASGAFIPKQSLTCDVLVVAGGGGGGRTVGGGGGAGGLLGFASQSLTATSYNVTVGGGGGGGTSFSGTGTTGNDSQFGALTLVKGGGGAGGGNGINGLTGGSGGGGGGAAQGQGGAGTSGQGFAGFTWGGAGLQTGGGGGGSSAAATNKNGSNGVTTYSSWGLATATGQNVSGTVYFAGGGGAGTNEGAGGGATVAGAGGLGGGASGRTLASAGVPTAALANTGGGGGGSGGNGDSSNGGAGGSGIVIVRYAK